MKQADAVRRRIGLAGQYAAVDPNLTGDENLRMMGILAQLPRPEILPRADDLLERFRLTTPPIARSARIRAACAGAWTSRRR